MISKLRLHITVANWRLSTGDISKIFIIRSIKLTMFEQKPHFVTVWLLHYKSSSGLFEDLIGYETDISPKPTFKCQDRCQLFFTEFFVEEQKSSKWRILNSLIKAFAQIGIICKQDVSLFKADPIFMLIILKEEQLFQEHLMSCFKKKFWN